MNVAVLNQTGIVFSCDSSSFNEKDHLLTKRKIYYDPQYNYQIMISKTSKSSSQRTDVLIQGFLSSYKSSINSMHEYASAFYEFIELHNHNDNEDMSVNIKRNIRLVLSGIRKAKRNKISQKEYLHNITVKEVTKKINKDVRDKVIKLLKERHNKCIHNASKEEFKDIVDAVIGNTLDQTTIILGGYNKGEIYPSLLQININHLYQPHFTFETEYLIKNSTHSFIYQNDMRRMAKILLENKDQNLLDFLDIDTQDTFYDPYQIVNFIEYADIHQLKELSIYLVDLSIFDSQLDNSLISIHELSRLKYPRQVQVTNLGGIIDG